MIFRVDLLPGCYLWSSRTRLQVLGLGLLLLAQLGQPEFRHFSLLHATGEQNPGLILTAALVLRKNGIVVRLIENALDYQIGVRGDGNQVSTMDHPGSPVFDPLANALLQPRILELFKILGLVTDIQQFYRAPLNESFQQFPTFANPGILVQSSTEAILRSHLSRLGVTAELGTEFVNFTQDAHKVIANLLKRDKSGSSENEALTGITRKHLGINFWGEPLEKQAFLVADVEMEGLDRQYWAAYGRAGTGLVLALPLGPARHFSVAYLNASPPIRNQVPLVDVTAHCGANIRCADKFNIGRVFIAGDAYGAHVHLPVGGQGLNSSVQDSRMFAIKEMLKLTTNLHAQSMSDRDLASKDTSQSVNPGLVREHIFKQLGVNYQWSGIVLDQRLDSNKNVNGGNKVYTPYGNEDEPIQAGDRAPDAPNLVLVPVTEGAAPTTTTLFDLLTPFAHTTLPYFNPGYIACARKYNKDGHRLVDSYLVLPENTADVGSGRVVGGMNRVVVDTQGHAQRAYVAATQARNALPSVIIICPDTYIGAFVHDAQGVGEILLKNLCLAFLRAL
ncbi:hypothetical protein BS47DRAFT_1485535 [Hydnum rufescens UP504]|uniref:FAD-binding domain-containing protein n=1 Tax=Hydnum rufescens UP504 TaxID=1448309 RepID=A0A9P6DXC5_9AGAM|nr:hypothetical protein BS47DRAFT_1485535 [Hydnum rufescens UP504]